MISSIVSMTVNIAVIELFGSRLGIGGIALTASFATAVNMAINLIFAYKKGILKKAPRDFIDISKSVLSAAVMGGSVWFITPLCEGMPRLAAFLLPVIAGCVVYAICALILKSEGALALLGMIKKKKGA